MKKTKNQLGVSVVVLTISKMTTLALSIITSMLLSRGLTLSQYGTYTELQTVVSLTVSIFALGLPNCINYFLPTCEADERKKFLGFYYTIITIISILIAVIMFFTTDLIVLYYKNPEISFYSFFLMVLPWAKIAFTSRSHLLVVDSKTKREFIYCIANAACLLTLSILMFLQIGTFKLFMILYIAVESFFALLSYIEAFKSTNWSLKPNFEIGLVKKIFLFSIPLGISTAMSTISIDLDKLIIGWFMDETAVAVYANAGKELPFSYITTAFTAVILPKIVKMVKGGQQREAVELWNKASELCLIVLAFCAAACIVFAPQIILFLYSEKYLVGVNIFRIYSLVLLVRITYWGMIINAYGKTRQILYNSIICVLVNLVLSLGLYYLIGFVGPAIATCISIAIMGFLNLGYSSRLTNIKMRNIFPWKNIGITLLINIAFGVVFYFIVYFIGLGVSTIDILIAVGLGVVWAVLYFLIFMKKIKEIWKSFSKEEKLSQIESEK